MQKKLENIFELINCWQQYIDVIYMTEIDVKLLDAVQDDASYAVNRMGHQKRVEEQNVKEKLNLLFGKDKVIDEKESSMAAYETVKEGETTDTTTTAWEDFGSDNEAQKVENVARHSVKEAKASAVDGIQSSDDEGSKVKAQPEAVAEPQPQE
jgi:hypothetical protein